MNQLDLFQKQDFDFIHKETGEKLKLKKDYGQIVTCYIEIHYYLNDRILIDVCICKKESLEKL